MVRRSNFRLLYRVIFFCFCLSFACFYPHAGGLGDDRLKGKTESKKLEQEFKSKPLSGDIFLEQDEHVCNVTEYADDDDAKNKTDVHQLGRTGKFLVIVYLPFKSSDG